MIDQEKNLDKAPFIDSFVASNSQTSGEGQGKHDDSSSASSISSVETARPSTSQRLNNPSTSYSSLWQEYFEEELFLETTLPNERKAIYHTYVSRPKSAEAPLIICHHGAGSTGLSFALFAKELQRALPKVGIMSIDARGHGSTVLTSSGTSDANYAIDELAEDLVNMINLCTDYIKPEACPSLVLVGHSLGGAVVTNVASSGIFGSKILGLAILDVVEGSALEALKTMQSYLSKRPKSFSSVENAVDWHLRTRTIKNPNSAKVSVPSLLCATSDERWTWRTELAETEPFWKDWFDGMSNKFLSSRCAKLLLLAGTDRLDKDLMIGQMQGMYNIPLPSKCISRFRSCSLLVGKFQLEVLPAAGHFVQEDLPNVAAEAIAEFVERNDRSKIILPPKVSDLIKQGKKV